MSGRRSIRIQKGPRRVALALTVGTLLGIVALYFPGLSGAQTVGGCSTTVSIFSSLLGPISIPVTRCSPTVGACSSVVTNLGLSFCQSTSAPVATSTLPGSLNPGTLGGAGSPALPVFGGSSSCTSSASATATSGSATASCGSSSSSAAAAAP
jgi:hypothetical protein